MALTRITNTPGFKILNNWNKVFEEPHELQAKDFDWENLELIGEGSFSKVYKVKNIISNEYVAAKFQSYPAFPNSESEKNKVSDIQSETEKLFMFEKEKNKNKYASENILHYFGYIKIKGPNLKIEHYSVMELATHGTLAKWIIDKISENNDDNATVYWSEMFSIIVGLMKALMFIHAVGYIHGDLKLENILMQGKVPKISDFGLVKKIGDKLTAPPGTLLYAAPEAFQFNKENPGIAATSLDCFSLAIILWACAANKQPGENIKMRQELVDFRVIKNMREPISKNCPAVLSKSINSLWHFNPEQRTTVEEVHEDIVKFIHQ